MSGADDARERSFLFLRNGEPEPAQINWTSGVEGARQAIADALNAKNVAFLLGAGCSSLVVNGTELGISTMAPLAKEFCGETLQARASGFYGEPALMPEDEKACEDAGENSAEIEGEAEAEAKIEAGSDYNLAGRDVVLEALEGDQPEEPGPAAWRLKKVYQHVSSPKDTEYLPQREALAARFRQQFGSDKGGAANTVPFIIGVFDTVASLGSYALSAALVGGVIGLIAALSYVQSPFLFPFLPTFLWTAAVAAVAAGIGYVATHLKYAVGLPEYSFLKTLHLASPKMKFYDLHLNNAVWYARHAMSIDENRADFARVQWGGSHNKGPERPDEYPDWLQQVWFPGNHSDVGGSYPENETRLSDISLGWMVHAG